MKKLILPLLIFVSTNVLFSIDQQSHKTREELIQDFTNVMTALYQKLVDTNIITIEHLKKLEKADRLINPLTREERNGLSSDQLVRIKELEARLNVPVIMPQINGWARKTIIALTGEQETKERIHEDTKEIYRSMRFFEVPASTYVDQITDETFEILPGIEVQDTPVTQWQWVQIMGTNPAHFADGKDSIEINKITMRHNAPVENVSWNDVQEFIQKLNEKNDGYMYALPSVQEYQSVMQKTFGLGMDSIYFATQNTHHDRVLTSSGRPECSAKLRECEAKTNVSKGGATQQVASGRYLELNGKRIWSLTSTIWQWTRDTVEMKNKHAHLAFGGSFATNKSVMCAFKDVLRPVFCFGSKSRSVGLRLMRYKKSERCEQKINNYNADQLSWNQEDELVDSDWQWNKVDQVFMFKNEGLCWMFEHKNEYPAATQHTLDVLYGAVNGNIDNLFKIPSLDLSNNQLQDVSPLAHLTNFAGLDLDNNQIQDVSPLAHLTNLTWLYLDNNHIQNVSPLVHLTNLTVLDLGKNQIQDASPLAHLTNLWHLYLHGNPIKVISNSNNRVIKAAEDEYKRHDASVGHP